jgi:general secretion pathway protein D
MKYIFLMLFLLFATGHLSAGTVMLEQKVSSFTLNESPLRDAVRLVSSASGMPVVCTPEAAELKVSLFFSDVSLEASLQAMCRSHGLWMSVSPEGVVIISTLAQHLASETVYAGDYMETLTVKYPTVNDVCDTLKGLFRDRIVWTRPDENDRDPVENIERALDRMDTLADRSQFDIAENSSSSSGSYSSRGSSRSSSSRSSSHRSTDYSSGEDLSQLQAIQKSDDFMRDIMEKRLAVYSPEFKGNSLIYLSALPEINTLLVRSSDRNAVQLVKDAVEKMDKPRGQVLLQVNVLSVKLDDSVETGVEWLFEEGKVSGGFTDSLIQSFSSDPAGYTAGKPVVSYLNDKVQARLSMLAKKENTRQLAGPTLLVADNEAANVFVGKDAKFLDQIEPGTVVNTDSGITVTDPSPTFKDRNIGLSLLITPRVHADRSVTLRIMQERSQEDTTLRSIDYGAARPVQVQDINQELVTSTLVAEDGALVILGGMISESRVSTDRGIPLLKDIPLLGRIFSMKSDQDVREELIVLIRPHVISVPGEGGSVSRDVLKTLNIDPDFSLNAPDENEALKPL